MAATWLLFPHMEKCVNLIRRQWWLRRSLCKTLISAERGWLWGGSSTSVFWSQDDFEWNGRVRRKHVRNLSQFTQQNSGLNCFLCTFSVLGFLGASLKPNNLESAPPTNPMPRVRLPSQTVHNFSPLRVSQTNHPSFCCQRSQKVFLGFQSTNFYCLHLWHGWNKLMQAKTRTRTTRPCTGIDCGNFWGSDAIGQSFTCLIAVSSPMRFVIWGGNNKHSRFLLRPHNSNKSV